MSGKSAHRFLVFSSLSCSQRYETNAVVVRGARATLASDIARCVQLLTIFGRLTLLMPKKEAPITSAEYRQLLKEIRSLVEGAKSEKVDGKVAAYWAIGQCLHQKKLSRRAHYGKSIIRDLAADSRLATRTLYDTLHFFESYPKPPIEHGLAWTHYRILLTLTTKKDREFYVQHIQNEAWSSRRLQTAIAVGMHEGNNPEDEELRRPTVPEYLFRVTIRDVIDADTLDLELDLGFDVQRKLRTRLAHIDTPEVSSPEGRKARDFVIAQLQGAKTIVIKSVKVDLHGRYLAHVFIARRDVGIAQCFKTGIYLNDLLIREGHAVRMD